MLKLVDVPRHFKCHVCSSLFLLPGEAEGCCRRVKAAVPYLKAGEGLVRGRPETSRELAVAISK